MLVLSRKRGERVIIGRGITVTVAGIHGNRVRVAIEAPDQVHIVRAELGGSQRGRREAGRRRKPARSKAPRPDPEAEARSSLAPPKG